MSGSVLNTAGELEREARSRRANALDALGLACGALIVLWPVCFGWGVLGGVRFVHPMAEGLLKAALLWAFAGSALWHRDTAESLGLGSPGRLWRMIRERRGVDRRRLVAAVLAVFGGLLWLSFTQWPRVARFFQMPAAARAWPHASGGWAAMSLFNVTLAALVATSAIRYDNFGRAFRLALTIAAALIGYAALAAWLYRGADAFGQIEPRRISLDVLAYTFWGFIQQLIFTAYAGTRLRKGFGPSSSVKNVVPVGERPRAVCIGGIVAAATLAPAVWLAVRAFRDPAAPVSLLAGCAAFAFPAGAVWTHFFCRDKKRMLVATLSGSIFGLVHIDSYGLVLVTTGVGTVFAYVAMEDRFRNLAALAFVHGFLGATFGKMFHGAGALRVDYHVGPWHVREPSASVLGIPMLFLAGYAALAAWAACRARREDEPPLRAAESIDSQVQQTAFE
jgi:hypothetical protein